jgi:hypothetical protein
LDDKGTLAEVILEGVDLRLVEPHIYSVHRTGEDTAPYDKFGGIYERV